MANPDSQLDNIKKLQHSEKHTLEKINKDEEYLLEHAEELTPEQVADIQARNDRRRVALDGLRSKIEEAERLEL